MCFILHGCGTIDLLLNKFVVLSVSLILAQNVSFVIAYNNFGYMVLNVLVITLRLLHV